MCGVSRTPYGNRVDVERDSGRLFRPHSVQLGLLVVLPNIYSLSLETVFCRWKGCGGPGQKSRGGGSPPFSSPRSSGLVRSREGGQKSSPSFVVYTWSSLDPPTTLFPALFGSVLTQVPSLYHSVVDYGTLDHHCLSLPVSPQDPRLSLSFWSSPNFPTGGPQYDTH